LRYYTYLDGAAEGKRNARPNVLSELNYAVTDEVTLTGSMEYDRRWSNRMGLDYTNWLFLAAVTFGTTYDLLPKSRSAL
jgi:hypothetical protein